MKPDKQQESSGSVEEKALDWMDNPASLSEEEFDALRRDPAFRRACKDIMRCRQAMQSAPSADADRAWQQFWASHTPARRNRHYWTGMAVGLAAGVALMLVFWWAWAYVEKDEVRVFAANDVPGEIVLQNGTGTSVAIDADTEESNLTRMGAVLTQRADTLGLAYTVAADQPVEQHTLSTPRGKDFRLTLADGTIVWLNAESRLEYPSRFTGSERRVRLKGEAYFQVAHNADVPFVVETECIRTRVLGTEFNLCSYAPADTHVTLIKGSVEVSSPQQTVPVRIEPGEEARLQADGSFALSAVDVDAYVYWKEGYFYFDNTPLADIMQAIGRWYNVNIVFRSRQAMTYKMHYFCERRKDIAHAVELLNMMGKVKATVEGNTVYVE